MVVLYSFEKGTWWRCIRLRKGHGGRYLFERDKEKVVPYSFEGDSDCVIV